MQCDCDCLYILQLSSFWIILFFIDDCCTISTIYTCIKQYILLIAVLWFYFILFRKTHKQLFPIHIPYYIVHNAYSTSKLLFPASLKIARFWMSVTLALFILDVFFLMSFGEKCRCNVTHPHNRILQFIS